MKQILIKDDTPMNRKLRESESLYRALFHHAHVIFSLYQVTFNESGSPIDMICVDVNPSFEKEFCIKAIEILGKSLTTIFPTIQNEEINWIHVMGEVAQTNQAIILEHDLFQRDCWYEASVYTPKPNFVAILATNLTKSKQYETKLKFSEERWRAALTSAKQGVWQKNFKTNQFFYSPWYTNLLGYEPGEIDSSDNFWLSQVHPDDHDRVVETFWQHANKQTPYYETEYRIKAKDNTYRWILSRGKAVKNDKGEAIECIGTHTDITHLKSIKQALMNSELLYRTLYENISDSIFLAETNELGNPIKYVEVNEMACNLLGYTKTELLNMSPMDIRPQKINYETTTCFRELKKKRCGIYNRTYKAKDGTFIPVEIRAKSFTLENVNYILGIARDLSERKLIESLLEQERKRQKRQVLLNEMVTSNIWNAKHWEELKHMTDFADKKSFICCLLNIHDQQNEHVDEINAIQDTIIEKLDANNDLLVWLNSKGIGIIGYCKHEASSKQGQVMIPEEILTQAKQSSSKFTMCIGVSEITTRITDIKVAFEQSSLAVHLGRKVFQNKDVFYYRELGVLQLVPFINDKYEISTYVDRTLGKIITYDHLKKANYIPTLEAILENNNLNDVAKVMFIHYKTVQLRKKKIEDILGISLDSFETRMSLSLALKLLKLLQHE